MKGQIQKKIVEKKGKITRDFLFLIIETQGIYIVCSVDSVRKEVSMIVTKCHKTIQVGTALPCPAWYMPSLY